MNDLIFGKTWEEIQDMQNKRHRPETVGIADLPTATDEDVKLLQEHGLQGLKDMEFYGVLDRLTNSGLIAAQEPDDVAASGAA